MTLKSLTIENFKAIQERINIDIKPLNILLGPNSGGKSSILHALALLKQTIMLPNETRALLLDDPTALVHLGRYINAVHGQSYVRQIGLGVRFESEKTTRTNRYKRLEVSWKFRGTKRTQDIFVSSSDIDIDGEKYHIREQSKGIYRGAFNGNKNAEINLVPIRNYIFQPLTKDRNLYSDWFTYILGQQQIVNELSNISYLGPFRDPPKRRYQSRGYYSNDVGPSGESAVPILVDEILRTRTRRGINQVEKWLQHLGLSESISLDREGKSDLFRVELQISPEFPPTTPADVGFGVSQILPVLVQCSYANTNSTLIIEQPEIHLHPNCQKRLPQIFFDTINKKQCNIIIETHSEKVIFGILEGIQSGNISNNDVQLLHVTPSNGKAQIDIFKPDQFGEIYENWQKGFCR